MEARERAEMINSLIRGDLLVKCGQTSLSWDLCKSRYLPGASVFSFLRRIVPKPVFSEMRVSTHELKDHVQFWSRTHTLIAGSILGPG